MKIIAIGDIHGRSDWKQIVSASLADKIVFLGDYFDSHENIGPRTQLENFQEILEYKNSHSSKVVLLIGNHDYHYLPGVKEHYSGYNAGMSMDFGETIKEAIDADMLQLCFSADGVVYSHAGFSDVWITNLIREKHTSVIALNPNDLNQLFKFKPRVFGFRPGDDCDMYGNETCQGPLWIRPRSLLESRSPEKKQVVGHTQKKNIEVISNIAFIDTLGISGEYLEVNNGEFKVRKNE